MSWRPENTWRRWSFSSAEVFLGWHLHRWAILLVPKFFPSDNSEVIQTGLELRPRLLSGAVIQAMTKSNSERKGLVWLAGYSPLPEKLSWEWMQRPWRVLFVALCSLLSYRTQKHLPWEAPTVDWALPTSTTNQENTPQTCGHAFSVKALYSQRILAQVELTKTSSHTHYVVKDDLELLFMSLP